MEPIVSQRVYHRQSLSQWYYIASKARAYPSGNVSVFAIASFFYSSLIFASKAGAYPSDNRNKLVCLPLPVSFTTVFYLRARQEPTRVVTVVSQRVCHCQFLSCEQGRSLPGWNPQSVSMLEIVSLFHSSLKFKSKAGAYPRGIHSKLVCLSISVTSAQV